MDNLSLAMTEGNEKKVPEQIAYVYANEDIHWRGWAYLYAALPPAHYSVFNTLAYKHIKFSIIFSIAVQELLKRKSPLNTSNYQRFDGRN